MAYTFGVPYHLVSHRGNGRCLNVYGNEQVSQNRNVCVWGWSTPETNAQKWVIRLEGAGGRIYSNLGGTTFGANGYGLNAYRTGTNWNCDIHTVNGNETDSLIDLLTVDAANNLYRIALVNYHGRYLTAEGTGDGANVSWAAASGGDNQVWKVTASNPAGSGGGGGGNTPGSPVMNGRFISHSGSGRCLNVYGDDTISNHRDVCLYEWSGTEAQRWLVANYAGQKKIFSPLQYPTYALNIYRNGTNNCDVFPHVGNDADSHVNMTSAGKADTYFIRLADGLTLTAGDNVNFGAVTWRPYTGADNQKWLYTTEPAGSVTPPVNPGTSDSALVTAFMQAAPSNYTVNRGAQGGSIKKITIHHCAGNMSVQALGSLWQNPARAGSSHYGVSGADVGQYVMEKDVAWTDGNWGSNIRSVTIETSNSGGAPNWPVAGNTFETLAHLVADIATRNGLGLLVKGVNLTWHSMYSATACPGPYLLSQMDRLAARANAIMGVSAAAYSAGVRMGTADGISYYDYTIPLDNLFAAAKQQAEEHRCMSLAQYTAWVTENSPWTPPDLTQHLGMQTASFLWFYSQVNHNAAWDIKRENRWNEALPNVPYLKDSEGTPKQFLYRGELCTAEIMGNIMYGYIGRACGFSAKTLYWGGGVAKQGSMNNSEVHTPELYGDDEDDHNAITYGFNLFESRYPDYPEVGFEDIPIDAGLLAALADLII